MKAVLVRSEAFGVKGDASELQAQGRYLCGTKMSTKTFVGRCPKRQVSVRCEVWDIMPTLRLFIQNGLMRVGLLAKLSQAHKDFINPT